MLPSAQALKKKLMMEGLLDSSMFEHPPHKKTQNSHKNCYFGRIDVIVGVFGFCYLLSVFSVGFVRPSPNLTTTLQATSL